MPRKQDLQNIFKRTDGVGLQKVVHLVFFQCEFTKSHCSTQSRIDLLRIEVCGQKNKSNFNEDHKHRTAWAGHMRLRAGVLLLQKQWKGL